MESALLSPEERTVLLSLQLVLRRSQDQELLQDRREITQRAQLS